jgi:hypothetical protein
VRAAIRSYSPQFKGLLKYVNIRDYQLFAKRLRKYLSKKIGKYEKIHEHNRENPLSHILAGSCTHTTNI